MTYTPHVLVTFGGSWTQDPSEIWECGVRLQKQTVVGTDIDPEAYLTAVSPLLKTWFVAAGTKMASIANLKFMKCNHINAAGRYTDGGITHRHDYPGTDVGGAPSLGPQFISRAFTWETAVKRGPAHRGRIYPPNATCDNSGSAFRFSVTNRDANATAGAGLLALLKNSAGSDQTRGVPVVASNVNGAIQPIIGCSSDDTFDVQRRRKNRIVPVRSAVIPFA